MDKLTDFLRRMGRTTGASNDGGGVSEPGNANADAAAIGTGGAQQASSDSPPSSSGALPPSASGLAADTDGGDAQAARRSVIMVEDHDGVVRSAQWLPSVDAKPGEANSASSYIRNAEIALELESLLDADHHVTRLRAEMGASGAAVRRRERSGSIDSMLSIVNARDEHVALMRAAKAAQEASVNVAGSASAGVGSGTVTTTTTTGSTAGSTTSTYSGDSAEQGGATSAVGTKTDTVAEQALRAGEIVRNSPAPSQTQPSTAADGGSTSAHSGRAAKNDVEPGDTDDSASNDTADMMAATAQRAAADAVRSLSGSQSEAIGERPLPRTTVSSTATSSTSSSADVPIHAESIADEEAIAGALHTEHGVVSRAVNLLLQWVSNATGNANSNDDGGGANADNQSSSSSTTTPIRTILRVESPQAMHSAVCDFCGVAPIAGVRYKCRACPDFDLCAECFIGGADRHPHALFDFCETPDGQWASVRRQLDDDDDDEFRAASRAGSGSLSSSVVSVDADLALALSLQEEEEVFAMSVSQRAPHNNADNLNASATLSVGSSNGGSGSVTPKTRTGATTTRTERSLLSTGGSGSLSTAAAAAAAAASSTASTGTGATNAHTSTTGVESVHMNASSSTPSNVSSGVGGGAGIGTGTSSPSGMQSPPPVQSPPSGGRSLLASTIKYLTGSKNSDPVEACCVAAKKGNATRLLELFSEQPDVDFHNRHGESPLQLATANRQLNCMRLLLERGVDPSYTGNCGYSPLHTAARDNYIAEARLLLEQGADVNAFDAALHRTPLHVAIGRGHLQMAQMLGQASGARVDSRDKHGNTALHIAVRREDHRAVSLLLYLGANPNARNAEGQTPVYVAKTALILGIFDQFNKANDLDVQSALEANVCTYARTGPSARAQYFFSCETCGLTNMKGVCVMCAKLCHQGHKLSTPRLAAFYCDCGAEEKYNCRATLGRSTLAATAVPIGAAAADSGSAPGTASTSVAASPANGGGKSLRSVDSRRMSMKRESMSQWLASLDLSEYESVFFDQQVDIDTVRYLEKDDLTNMGITALGPLKKLLVEIENLRLDGFNNGDASTGINATSTVTSPPLSPSASFRRARHTTTTTADSAGDLQSSGSAVSLGSLDEGVWLPVGEVVPVRAIGEGAFGQVFEGQWQGTTKVAMKKLSDSTQAKAFIDEASLLKKLRHPHVVLFLGLYKDLDGAQWIITEYLAKGSLLALLHSRDGSRLGRIALLDMAQDAAAGMKYLSQNRVLHRDLAARNLLVKMEEGKYIVKVADFGMSRFAELYVSSSTRFPVKWTAPEALQFAKFTTKSDVWSFGVVLWEMFEYGKVPYQGMSNREAMDFVLEGSRMARPAKCPRAVYTLMNDCWREEPPQRPTFHEVHAILLKESQRLAQRRLAKRQRRMLKPSAAGDGDAATSSPVVRARGGGVGDSQLSYFDSTASTMTSTTDASATLSTLSGSHGGVEDDDVLRGYAADTLGGDHTPLYVDYAGEPSEEDSDDEDDSECSGALDDANDYASKIGSLSDRGSVLRSSVTENSKDVS